MAGIAKVKVSGSVEEGLQIMTQTEIINNVGQEVTEYWASVETQGSLRLRSSGSTPTGHTDIGTFTDTKRDDSVGTHPTDGATSTVTTYTLSQETNIDTGPWTFPVRIQDDGDLKEYDQTTLKTDVLDDIITAMVTENAHTVGQYRLQASAPSGGTWTNRGNIVDTQVDGTTVTKTLWQKTAATTDTTLATGNRPVKKLDDNSLQEMTDSETRALYRPLGQRMIETGVGVYQLSQNSPPLSGTWQQMGEIMTDQVKNTASYAYAGSYTGSYTGNYNGSYQGTYEGSYQGTYRVFYSGYSGTPYTGSYTGYYTGTYTGTYTGSYSGSYVGYYAGNTIISTSSTIQSRRLWLRTAA
ncbi:MAG: hypothetical protein CBB67_005955 [Alteromonadaceae bacterium TMED7]|nr:hypothetical protein [Alteromonas sp.]RPH20507.1 MAG: hypothetical protein CBB67_005955 [Alteromonadaceae bacterium TMED7]|tara:strand:- start:1898 stop:2959 length:1062 start_codon:yes stop_codon:yes gene_type:complete